MAVASDLPAISSAVVDTAAWVAGIGPVTSTGEVVATSIGAGILLGGFAGGTFGMLRRWTRRRRDEAALRVGYFGGIGMAVAVVGEALTR